MSWVFRTLSLGGPLLCLGVSLGCTSLPADGGVEQALTPGDAVDVVEADGLIAFVPDRRARGPGLVFYPGGLVEELAYAPFLRSLAEEGVPTVLVPAPSDLAVLAPKKGDRALEAFPDLGPWVAGGHSLGGAMAATWADTRRDALDGLLLLAAYPAEGRELSDWDGVVVSVTASEDGVLDEEKHAERRTLLPDDTWFLELEGGNHAGFGAYGPQDGDGEATISPTAQQQLVVEAYLEAYDVRR